MRDRRRASRQGSAVGVGLAAGLALGIAAALGGCTAGAVTTASLTPAAEPCADGAVMVGGGIDNLQRALDAAEPGDVLQLEATTYVGTVTITRSGTADSPIVLCGSPASSASSASSVSSGSIIDGGGVDSGYTIHLDGAAYWTIADLAVTRGAKGVVLDGANHNELRGIEVSGTGDEGIHLRSGSSDNTVSGVTVSGTGVINPEFGEGIYVGSAESNWCTISDCEPDRSDRNRIIDSVVHDVTAEAIDIKEGTSSGEISGNRLDADGIDTVDSVVDLKGTRWVFEQNEVVSTDRVGVQIHVILAGWGADNEILGNTFDLAPTALAVSVVGDARATGNVVGCDNRTAGSTGTASTQARSNVACA